MPAVGPIFEEYVASAGLSERLRFYPGDFFADPLPSADVLIMGHILHDWDLEQKVRQASPEACTGRPSSGGLPPRLRGARPARVIEGA